MKTATTLRFAIGLIMALGLGAAPVAQSEYQPPINLTPFDSSGPLAVNNSGQAVGWYNPGPPSFAQSGAFSWTPTGGLVAIGPVQRPGNEAVAVNDSGQVVGSIARHAFLWTLPTGIIDLGTLGGPESQATAINASGQISGWSDTVAEGQRHAFVWTPAEGMVDLGTLGGASDDVSEARAVNINARVVGWSEGRSEIGGFRHAFSWTPTERMVDLGTLGGRDSDAVAVNATDRIVGWSEIAVGDDAVHAFSWTPTGGMVDLGTLGGVSSKATAVSATGQIVGWSEIAIGDDAVHAFSWTPAGGMVDLGTLGRRDSSAVAVNAAGRVVGTVWTQPSSPFPLMDLGRRAFSWTAEEGMVGLGTLEQGRESLATALNERGDVVGRGTNVPPPPPNNTYFPPFKATMWRRLLQPDITPPTLIVPDTIVVNATSPAGATVTYAVSAIDEQDPNPVVSCSPPSGSVFPRLASTVSCTATDAAGNSATGTFEVVVLQRGVTPPTLILPATIVVNGTSPAGATVTYAVSATDDEDPNPTVVCTPPSGSVFPLLASTVSCTATDEAGNSATGTFQVVVLDARQQLQETIDLIASYHLTRLGTSVPDKLQLASGFVAARNVSEACGVLTAFLNQVSAQTGKALTVEQATELIMRASRIRNVIGC